MTVELALLRAARPEIDPSRAALNQRIERLEAAVAGTGPAPAAPAAPAPAAVPTPPVQAAPVAAPEPESAAPEPTAVEAAPEPAVAPAPEPEPPAEAAAAVQDEPSAAGRERVIELWPGVLEQMRQDGAGMLSAVVGIARPVAVDEDEGTVTIAFPPGSAFNRRKADDKDNRELVAKAILSVLGTPLRPVYTMLDDEPEAESAPAGPGGDEAEAATGENELVERFIAEFDAEVVIDDEPDKPMEETS